MKTYAKITAWAMLAILFLSLLPILWLGIYNHPTGDDYYYGVEAKHAWQETKNPLSVAMVAAKGVSEQYQIWQGTYSAMFLMYLAPNVFGEEVYHCVTLCMITLLLCGIFYLSREILCHLAGCTWAEWIAFSSVLSFLCVQTLPFASEAFFWYNGSMYYTGYFAITLIYFGLLCRVTRLPRLFPCILASILALFLAGGNYISLLPAMLLSLTVLAWQLWEKKPSAKFLFPPCLCLIIGFLISAMAPGNQVRQSGMWKISPLLAILKALRQGLIFLHGWTSLWLVLGIALLTPIAWKLFERLTFSFPLPALAVGFAYGIMCSATCPTFYTMNSTGPARAAAIMYYLFLIFVFFSYFYFLGYVHRILSPQWRKKAVQLFPAWEALSALSLVLCLLFGNPSSLIGMRALACLQNGSATAYEAEYQKRLRLLTDASLPDVVLPSYQTQADLLYVGDLSSDPSDPTNQRVAQYFDKDSVTVSYH